MIPAPEPPRHRRPRLRGPAQKPKRQRRREKTAKVKPISASNMSLVFDTETFVDAAQQLRVGCYQLRRRSKLVEEGLFYDPASLTRAERRLIRRHSARRGLRLLSDREFVDKIFYPVAFGLNGTVVGFNLGFDTSRLAIGHDSARRKMRGGFTFRLSQDRSNPNVQVKHLSSRASIIRFASQVRQRTARSGRRAGRWVPVKRGFFCDVRTLAGALLGGSHSLLSLSKLLDTSHKKIESDEHGRRLTTKYLGYLRNDVQVTWECFERLRDLYATYGLDKTPITKLYSEASLGKALLRQMDIRPWRELQPGFPRRSLGRIMATYFGGRSEVRIRRQIARVLYLDFLSMYSTACARMGLWRFVIAKGIRSVEATLEVRSLLARIDVEDIRDDGLWKHDLMTIVQVNPDADIFPVRSRYDGEQYTIGLNYLSSDRPCWYTLADCIAATLLTGRPPDVIKALRYEPVGVQDDLGPIDLLGRPEFRIDPYRDDLFRRMIELRSDVKQRRNAAWVGGDQASADRFDAEQESLKILASSTSYGIFVELNVANCAKNQDLICHTGDSSFPVSLKNVEEPGRYFHPLLATLITGAARLLLATTEVLTEREGLGWMLCDTDSWALARPDGMTEQEFLVRAERIREWFQGLSPYATDDPILKLEDVNFGIEDGALTKEIVPLYGLAISDKRYVLFNVDEHGKPVIRKASAHGLGHLLAPYSEDEAPTEIPAPVTNLSTIGVDRWHYDLWYRIVEAALDGHPGQVDLDLPGYNEPAAARYAATTPNLLRWFRRFNADRPYREQVRPFGFLLSLQRTRRHVQGMEVVGDRERRGRGRAKDEPQPVAAFDKDVRTAVLRVFDRLTGFSLDPASMPTYRETLAQYHLHPEDKFLDGDFLDSGLTRRRHIRATSSIAIGKEADRWEEAQFVGLESDARIEYGESPEDRRVAIAELLTLTQGITTERLARAANLSVGEISMVRRGKRTPTIATVTRLREGLRNLRILHDVDNSR